MFSTVMSFACSDSRSRSASLVNSSVMARPVKREFAITRRNALSSSHTLAALGRTAYSACQDFDRSAVFHVERTYRLHLVAGFRQFTTISGMETLRRLSNFCSVEAL